jgi:hypothetical protein
MACDTKDYRPVSVPPVRRAAYRDRMTALQARPEQLQVDLTASEDSPLDGLVADAREVAVALVALRTHSGRGAVRIPATAYGVVEDLGAYGA